MKSINLKIETQSFDNRIVSVCHINKSVIAFENSEIAQKLFKINRPLFERINKETKLLNASIAREETLREKTNYNYLMSKVESVHESRTKNILNFSFEDSKIIDCHRFKLQSGIEVDITADKFSNFSNGGPLDLNNITADDLNSAYEVSKISKVDCFNDQGVESFILIDNLKNNFGITKIKHKVSISYEHQFLNYIKNILNELLTSITFLKSYFSSSKKSNNYNSINNSFSKAFEKETFAKLGLDSSFASRVNLADPSIIQSPFGHVGVIYYNALSILEENVDKNIYHSVMKKILPTKLSSPETIELIIKNLSNFYDRINKAYLHPQIKIAGYTNRSASNLNTIEVSSNIYEINKEKVGYRIFEEPVDFNKMTKSLYKIRCNSEKQRYFPYLSTAGVSYMYPNEVQEFSDTSNFLSFLTPLEILMEGKKMITDRGLGNLKIEDLKVFRLVKASKFRNRQVNNAAGKIGSGFVQDTLSNYNLQIEPLRKSIKEKKINGETNPLIDSKHYLGDDSYFQSFDPLETDPLIRPGTNKNKKRILNVVAGIVPRKFLRPPNSLKSIKDIQISKKNSSVNNMITQRKISLKSLPPQIKFMMTDVYQPAPDIDPLKNFESREIIEETQKNIFQMKALVGFLEDENGMLDLNMPIHQDVNQDLLDNNRSYLIKAHDYEVPELGIVKDKMLATIYNNLYFISKE